MSISNNQIFEAIGALRSDLEKVWDVVSELRRTLRGENGTLGLVTRFEMLVRDVAALANKVEQRRSLEAERTESDATEVREAPKEKGRSRWNEILDRIISTVVGGFIIWVLLTYFPATYTHIFTP